MASAESRTVLVVDDEPDLQELISFEFETKGYQTLSAGSGRAAQQLASERKIDAVITDIRMPGGDGVELLRELKKGHPDRPALIFITAFADLSVEEAYDRGAEGIFTKPFSRKSLVESIGRALLPRSERWKQKPAGPADLELEREWSNLDEAVSQGRIRFGRGGIYFGSSGGLPHVGESLEFRIRFLSGELNELHGRGHVRWVRSASTQAPAGFGLELDFIADSCRDAFIARIDREPPLSYIPSGA